MTPHLHTSKSAFGEMGASDGQTNKIENTERAVTTNSSPEANGRVPRIDPQIHTTDIAQFAKFGFEEEVDRLANRSGFQSSMIRDVYKHSSTFKQAENIAKAMRVAAVSDGEDGETEEDEEEEEEEEEKKENKEGRNEDKDEEKNKGNDVKDEDESCKEDKIMLVSSARSKEDKIMLVSSARSKEDKIMLVSSARVVKLSASRCVSASGDKEDRMMLVFAQSSPPELVVDNGPKEDKIMLVSGARIV
ncbi:hypothetical protein EDB19DRAFT_1835909 [Suillus lakei]|nr:hypothetical protein EDB19DRAFT_1835909 [Suillus lakei]